MSYEIRERTVFDVIDTDKERLRPPGETDPLWAAIATARSREEAERHVADLEHATEVRA